MSKWLLFILKKGTCTVLLLLLLYLLTTTSFWHLVYPISYEKEVLEAAETYDVDPYLILAIIQTESQFEQHQQSHKGAVGLMQLMPETARWANELSKVTLNNERYLWDPEVNIFLGTWYLSFLLDTYDGNIVKAVAAYNAGQGHVNNWLADGVWNGSIEQLHHIPFGETRHYLVRVLFYYSRYLEVYQEEFLSS